MKKNLLLIALFTVGLALIEACSCFTSCGCGGSEDAPDYFDFKRLTTEVKQGIGAESLRILLKPDSVEYLATAVQAHFRLGLITTAMGCSPEFPGESGMKFPITSIDISADQAFNDSLPAGASLHSLFLMTTEPEIDPSKEFGNSELASLDALGTFAPYRNGDTGSFLLVSNALPSNTNLSFKFTVTFTKSDGSTVAVTTDAVTF